MKRAVVLLVLAAVWLGCRPAAPWLETRVVTAQPAATRSPSTRVVRSHRWSFRIPEGWTARVSPTGDRAVAQSPLAVGSTPVHITLAIEPFHGTSDWLARERLARTGVVIVGSRETRAGRLPATDVEAVYSDADGATRFVQRYTTDAGLGFVLTCSSEHGWFERIRPACAFVLGTFRVRP